MIKADKSLEEVWEMKERAYEDFLKSGYDNIIEYIQNDTADVIKKYNIKYHFHGEAKEKVLVEY